MDSNADVVQYCTADGLGLGKHALALLLFAVWDRSTGTSSKLKLTPCSHEAASVTDPETTAISALPYKAQVTRVIV